MEQIKKFLHGKGFALVLAVCLLAAAAAGVWAVRTVRDELRQNLTDLTNPSSTARQTIPEPEPDPDVGLEEEELWFGPSRYGRAGRQQRSRGTAARAGQLECLVWCGIWLWFGARTLCLAHRLCTCRKLSRACLHAAVLWPGAQRLQW